jgi:AbrB family looped-hinge helix DNA binding protein
MNATIQWAKLGVKGQLVIPNDLRAALDLEAGDIVTVQLEGGRLILERRKTVIVSLLGKYSRPAPKPVVPMNQLVLDGGESRGP